MKRNDLIKERLFEAPNKAQISLIIDTDAKNEADDQYAIMHHLLSPKINVLGIVATHYEGKAIEPGVTIEPGTTMEESYNEVVKLLSLAKIDDIPVYRGCQQPLKSFSDQPNSEGTQFIIDQARNSEGKIYIAAQGAVTNIASALNSAPDIGDKLVILWNGGGPYPEGRREFNVSQDPEAVRVILASTAEIWQTHQDVYMTLEVSLAEIARRVRPCGELGAYLFNQLIEESMTSYNPHFQIRSGENWTLGDNTTVAVLLMNQFRGNWHYENAPVLKEDLTYDQNPNGKKIRVYDWIDVRMTIEDLFCKFELAYGSDYGL